MSSQDRDRLRATASPRASPKGEVGEIDTRAPFQSVKAAVSLFGEVAASKGNPIRRSRLSSENVLDRETQLLLSQKELERIKKQLESDETTKSKALYDLERAKRAMQELTARLKAVTESKESAIKDAEAVKHRAKQLEVAKSQKHLGSGVARNEELSSAREHYVVTATEINAVKQELNKIRQDFDLALGAKYAAFQQAAEAEHAAKASSERVSELKKEISAIKEGIDQIKLASQETNEEFLKIEAQRDTLKHSYITAKETAENRLDSLLREYDPEVKVDLEIKLEETTAEIEDLQRQMKEAHAAEMDAVRIVTAELNEATKALQEVADEECSLRNLVNSLDRELGDVKKESAKLIEKEKEREREREAEEKRIYDEHMLELEHLSSEAEAARREAEEIRKSVEALEQEAEASQKLAVEYEKKGELALVEGNEAREKEKKATEELNVLSSTKRETAANIAITTEEFESFNKKVESGDLAQRKVVEIEAEIEVINASKSAADQKLEASLKAIEEIKEATEMALKSAETAAAAQKMVEAELRRWRQQEEQITEA